MKQQKIFSNKYLNYSLILIFGLFLGWVIFHPKNNTEPVSHNHDVSQETIWTCSMHPNIRVTEPGKCPLCGMNLIPLTQGKFNSDSDAILMTPEAAQLANVQTSPVSRKIPVKEIRLFGKIEADERLIQNQVAHISGRIESLNVNFTGEKVSIGQTLGQIYSPDLVIAQQELLEAAGLKGSQPAIYEAAKEKLRQWKLSDDQISEIELSGLIQSVFKIISNTSGVITSRKVSKGDYVEKGTVLFEITDLSKVWIMFDAYESDLPFLKNGEEISFTIQAIPGTSFNGKVMFIDPVIDQATRISKVRVESENKGGRLKPGMFVTGNAESIPDFGENTLVIPRSAVLWTGKRSVVYVKQLGIADIMFKMREIVLGPVVGESYIVEKGLTEGEEIVTNGTFSVDASAQLAGKPSMMSMTSSVPVSSTGMKMGNIKSIIRETFEVSGSCEMCKERIENAAREIKGVSYASWDISTKMMEVEINTEINSLDYLRKSIADSGHDNGKFRAPDEVYNKLPECCLYRK